MVNERAPMLADPFTTSLAGRRLGRYEVLTRLASGGMAGVYVARALGVAGFERLFAVKVLHPHLAHEEEFITMFLDEARLAARIHHPNVVATIDISDTRGAGYYLVMDYIEGDHLGALLQCAFKAGSRLPAPVALRIVVDALNGLAAAHTLTDENGRLMQLVHRDVSPHNIMVSTDGISRLSDFGVAKAEVRLSTTREGQFKGKLAYMAPEHASTGEADQRSDLFSMGIILWEALTGTRLFRAENHAATLNKICLEPIPMPSSVDPELEIFDPILARALARDPADRYATAEEFAETIEEHAHALGGLATHRVVGQLVRKYASEKLGREAELIRTSISDLSAAGPPQEPSRDDESVLPDRPGPQAAGSRAPSSLASVERVDRKPTAWWIAALVVLAIVGVAIAVQRLRSTNVVQTSPLPAPSPSAAPAAEAAPAPAAPEAPTADVPVMGEAPAARPQKAADVGGDRAQPGERAGDTRGDVDPAPADPEKARKRHKGRRSDDLILNPYR